jgi:hypothetical protein
MLLNPYKSAGMWVFDDPTTGLVKEPFVCGIDTMITALVKGLGLSNPENGFALIFSGEPFPGYHLELNWKRQEHGGNWYYCVEQKIEGWLCPSLFKYFPKVPDRIFALARNV